MLRLLKGGSGEAGKDRTPQRPARADDTLAPLARSACAGDAQAQRTLLITLGPSLLRVVRGVLGAHHPGTARIGTVTGQVAEIVRPYALRPTCISATMAA